jgi:hypothetical protein
MALNKCLKLAKNKNTAMGFFRKINFLGEKKKGGR